MIKAEYNDLIRELWLRKREQFYWETRDGKKIPLTQMTDEHLVNAINYINRMDEEREIVFENWEI